MRSTILICGLATACISDWPETRTIAVSPGQPSISMNTRWVQGRPTQVTFEWPNREECNFDDWFCRTPAGISTTVLDVACDGCTILTDPTGTTQSSAQWFTLNAVAVIDGKISVRVHLRFDGTGAESTVSSSALGEHEVALDVVCKTIDVAEIHSPGAPPDALVNGAKLRPCGATRLATDIVVAFPRVRTSSDHLDFPFCFPTWGYCYSSWKEPLRPLSELAIQPAAVDWRQIAFNTAGDLTFAAEFPADVTGTIAFRTQLLGGIDATASFEVPAVAAQP